MCDAVDSDNLHLHLDADHLKVRARTVGFDPFVFVERFRDRIMACHLHDNDGL